MNTTRWAAVRERATIPAIENRLPWDDFQRRIRDIMHDSLTQRLSDAESRGDWQQVIAEAGYLFRHSIDDCCREW